MSLILVRPEPVRHPYYVEALGIHIGSSKELCYVIYNNPLLAMGDFVNERLIGFIRSDLDMPYLADHLQGMNRSGQQRDEMLIVILEECYYYTAKEINRFRQRLEAYRKMSTTEFVKETGDYYFRLKQYGTAVHYYERILDDWRVKTLTDDFTAAVWNNIGACYAGVFWFEKAINAYEMAYNFRKDMNTIRKIYILTLFNPELRIKGRYQALITEERAAAWKKELEELMEKEETSEAAQEIEELFRRDSIRRLEGAGKLLSTWKREYRKML